MHETLGDMIEQLVKIIFIMLTLFIIVWSMLFWLTWTMGKGRLDRAMTDIQDQMRKEGFISEQYVRDTVDSYCEVDAYTGMSILDIKPGFNVLPQYIGQPMYIEVQVVYHIFLRDIKISGRADIGNSGFYGKGYNTKSEVN